MPRLKRCACHERQLHYCRPGTTGGRRTQSEDPPAARRPDTADPAQADRAESRGCRGARYIPDAGCVFCQPSRQRCAGGRRAGVPILSLDADNGDRRDGRWLILSRCPRARCRQTGRRQCSHLARRGHRARDERGVPDHLRVCGTCALQHDGRERQGAGGRDHLLPSRLLRRHLCLADETSSPMSCAAPARC